MGDALVGFQPQRDQPVRGAAAVGVERAIVDRPPLEMEERLVRTLAPTPPRDVGDPGE